MNIKHRICNYFGINFKKLKFRNNVNVRKNNIYLGRNVRFDNSLNIEIGENVHIGEDSVISALKDYHTFEGIQKFNSYISIGNGVQATSRLQIYSASEIVIEDNVLFASNVFICDASHGLSLTNIPFSNQPLERIKPIRIGKGSWIGQNVVIMPGVIIGEFSIIGANSVVTKSIPNNFIAYGNPAKPIRPVKNNP
jgi:acetyltransferase-like isoleucine patch superfamily enzyme